ncbi:hypothetical protein DAMA08_012190 [Martiniozyma asiatica (nom. inval.)]|nr:hypothetical protein DAMA08_012190 [Martiniozyma asiatica]
MNENRVQLISSKFSNENIFLCYEGIFNPFIDYNNSELRYYISRGVRFNFEFAKMLNNYYMIDQKEILSSISASYIMNNCVEGIEIVKNVVPKIFWYPKSPSKETCLKLIKINEEYNYLVAMLSIMNKWYDVLEKCSFSKKEILLERMYNKFNLGSMGEFDESFSIFLSSEKERTDFEFFLYNGYFISDSDYNVEEFHECIEGDCSINLSNDIGPVNCSSINSIIYENKITIPFVNFNLQDIKYNFLLSHYILSHHNNFSRKECSLALSNYLVSNIYKPELVKEYDVFYLFTYKICSSEIVEQLFKDFEHLKYNIAVILCMDHYITDYSMLNLEPDIDIYSIAKFYGNQIIMDDMLKKNKEKGVWYRHLDFEKGKNLNPGVQVSIDSKIDYGNLLTTSIFK